ncbi:GGDEF domain-containing protein [Mesorhizobium sp. BAC0120]|uniref:GGDEF domain-containing protein n=1 Tax=Mesorhizobium sp. BAC0120 TaxID=3090670 RepID=UPI00298CE295|nr:GGDEF domain-containing protein [Mesorhizobium sp. BAC0120]MDW6024616.1 GGDEF domain-containing protein [Mesorhizobium sp. BAC0120]
MFTVGLLAGIASALGCLTIVIIWLRDRSTASYAWWVLAFLLSGLGVALTAQRHSLLQLTTIGLPGFAALLSVGAFWCGLRVFDRRSLPVLALVPLVIWALGLPFVHHLFALRQMHFNIAIGTATLLVGVDLWRSTARELSPRFCIALICLFETLVSYRQAIALALMRDTVGQGPLHGWLTFAPFQSAVALVAIVVLGILMIAERTQSRFRDLAMNDQLTGVLNRRGFFETGANQLEKLSGTSSETAIALFDIDFFKAINDKHGHPAGDTVIAEFARRAVSTIRPGDIFGRIGGEEFALLLPDTTLNDARLIVERVRATFSGTPILHDRIEIMATASAGISIARSRDANLDQFISLADSALYAAKKAGRNRTSILRTIADRDAPAITRKSS